MWRKLAQRGGMILTLGNGFSALFGLLSFAALARQLDTANFGLWALYLAAFGLFDMVRKGFIRQAMVKYVSGTTDAKEKAMIQGAAWFWALAFSVFSGGLVALLVYLFPATTASFHLQYFGQLFPFLMIATLPFEVATWMAHANKQYARLAGLRVLQATGWLVLILALIQPGYSMLEVGYIHLAWMVLISMLPLLFGWTTLSSMGFINRKGLQTILWFGKYSLGTLLGSNLLKSADTFLITRFMGPVFTGIYNVPLKLTELAEIPLRSFAMSAFPNLSRWSATGNMQALRQAFYRLNRTFLWLSLPFLLIGWFMAPYVIYWIAGAGFEQGVPVFRVFLLYIFLLPIDRFVGITLDAMGRPKVNMVKVLIMSVINIAGNIIALVYFQSLVAVAWVTVLNIMVGIAIGWWQLNRALTISLAPLVKLQGWRNWRHPSHIILSLKGK